MLTHDPTAAKKTYGVYIKRIKLRVRTVKLDPQRAATIYRTLQKSPAVYPTPVMSTALIYNGVHGWSLPPNTCKWERKIARIISRQIKRDGIYEELAVHAADNITDALHEMSHNITFDRIVSSIGYIAYLHRSKEDVLQEFFDFYDTAKTMDRP